MKSLPSSPSVPRPIWPASVMRGVKVEPFPVEVIVRGFITGVTKTALWYRYSLGEREIYGHSFPEGLTKNQKLPENIITPTTKLQLDLVAQRNSQAEQWIGQARLRWRYLAGSDLFLVYRAQALDESGLEEQRLMFKLIWRSDLLLR